MLAVDVIHPAPAPTSASAETGEPTVVTEHVVTVSDGGVGIAPEHLERVFAPFFTTKPRAIRTEPSKEAATTSSTTKNSSPSFYLVGSIQKWKRESPIPGDEILFAVEIANLL